MANLGTQFECNPIGALAEAQATIARLTAELAQAQKSETGWRRKNHALRDQLAQARAEAVAAYERSAQVCDDVHIILGDGPKRIIGEYQEDVQPLIRALATEPGTTALGEIVKKAVDAETRACAVVALDWWKGCDKTTPHQLILARIDQRKEAGE